MARPTVHDIAREAGVSLATVDRVLNARPGVRAGTIAKVEGAVARLGYVRDRSAANLARKREYRFAFVLPDDQSGFGRALRAALREAASSTMAERTQFKVVRAPWRDPHAIVRTLRALDADKLDGLALMAPETPQVRDAVARLKDAGLAIVALASDLPQSRRDFFVGVDSVAAGRTAGLLMGRFARGPGDVLVVANSLRSRDSLERRFGFDAVLAAEFDALEALPTIEAHGDPARMRRIVGEALARRPELVGVYSMSSGNATLLDALAASGRGRRLVVLAHELTPATRAGLRAGAVSAVIAQHVGHLVRSALRVLRNLTDDQPIFEAQERVRIDVVLRENIP